MSPSSSSSTIAPTPPPCLPILGPTSPQSRLIASGQRYLLFPTFTLESGITLHNVPLAYKTWGKLDPRHRDNVIVVCHALTGSADVEDWWGPLLGPGKLFDPTRFFIFCANVLGSPYGSGSPCTRRGGELVVPRDEGNGSGDAHDERSGRAGGGGGERRADAAEAGGGDGAAGRPRSEPRPLRTAPVDDSTWWGPEFPATTVRDDIRLAKMALDFLGVEQIASVIGGSMGGMAVLEWPLLYPVRFPPHEPSRLDPPQTTTATATAEKTASSLLPSRPPPPRPLSSTTPSSSDQQQQQQQQQPPHQRPYIRSISAIATCARHSAWCISWAETQRQSIHSDPTFNGGYYKLDAPPRSGLAAARMAALLTYRSRDSFESRFGRRIGGGGGRRKSTAPTTTTRAGAQGSGSGGGVGGDGDGRGEPTAGEGEATTTAAAGAAVVTEPRVVPPCFAPSQPNLVADGADSGGGVGGDRQGGATASPSTPATANAVASPPPTQPQQIFSAQSYLRYQGDKFVRRFDANCYVHLTRKMDMHDLARGRAHWGLGYRDDDDDDERDAGRGGRVDVGEGGQGPGGGSEEATTKLGGAPGTPQGNKDGGYTTTTAKTVHPTTAADEVVVGESHVPREGEEDDEVLQRVLSFLGNVDPAFSSAPTAVNGSTTTTNTAAAASEAATLPPPPPPPRRFGAPPPRVHVVSIESDGLFNPPEQTLLRDLIPGSRLDVVRSPDGHDGFLLEFEQVRDFVGGFLRDALSSGASPLPPPSLSPASGGTDEARRRVDDATKARGDDDDGDGPTHLDGDDGRRGASLTPTGRDLFAEERGVGWDEWHQWRLGGDGGGGGAVTSSKDGESLMGAVEDVSRW